jgi:hypothetical protein
VLDNWWVIAGHHGQRKHVFILKCACNHIISPRIPLIKAAKIQRYQDQLRDNDGASVSGLEATVAGWVEIDL